MGDPLQTYLADHLAGSVHAIEVLKALRDNYDRDPMGSFAADLSAEVEEDRETLKSIAGRVGSSPSEMKELGAWLSEKAGRLKLGHGVKHRLGTFEAIEFLSLGVLGKLALWRALSRLAPLDQRLHGDYKELIARAEAQHAKLEAQRLDLAAEVLRPASVQAKGRA
jgi:hypothetical protein